MNTNPNLSIMSPRAEDVATLAVATRLPKVGTTVFTVMSALAQEHGAVNLGQGFPDFNCDQRLIDAVDASMRAGFNQYPPMAGATVLREAISDKIAILYGRRYRVDTEITVTAGATQAIMTAVLALVHPGDEVVVLEPVYDCYVPAIELAGARAVAVAMRPPSSPSASFRVDWDDVRRAVTRRTRAIIVNSPHNPTGSAFDAGDIAALERLVIEHGLYVISDEVYEHMLYDDCRHESLSRHAALAERSIVVSSFGKAFHVTGWKVGYAAAPAALTAEFRKVHQFNVFTVNTPMQHGIAAYLKDPRPYLELPAFYQAKRDRFRNGLKATRFGVMPCQGSYFQLASYGDVALAHGIDGELEFCKWLIRDIGVAAIPVSAFYESGEPTGYIRFCFAKQEATLDEALARLARI